MNKLKCKLGVHKYSNWVYLVNWLEQGGAYREKVCQKCNKAVQRKPET